MLFGTTPNIAPPSSLKWPAFIAYNFTTSFFSFYDVTEKIGIVIGMFSFGLIEELTGSMKNSVLVVMCFFIIGFILLFLTLKKEQHLKKSLPV
jgi:UMF1 family MFS transporter